VNREYAEVLVEQNINGKTDTSYVYGANRLSLDRFDGSTGYYLYDPRGSVTGITNEEGQLYQSYRYGAYGEITFGAPQYENEYTYNGESYNPNIESQYLRSRYYYVVTATFLTEDSYLGYIVEPLTLNRYIYCVASPLNYIDPSGHKRVTDVLPSAGIAKLLDPKEPEPPIGYDVYLITPFLRLLPPLTFLNKTKAVESMKQPYDSLIPLYKTADSAKEKDQVNICVIEGPGNPAITNDWIRLYGEPTVSGTGRSVITNTDKEARKYDWAAPEELNGTGIAQNKLPKIAQEVIERSDAIPTVNLESNNIYSDAEGRYWVAVGPNVMNPNHQKNATVTEAEMQYGTKIDIKVLDESSNTYYYIPAVVADVKNHTYPDGLYQTGKAFPDGTLAPDNIDGSSVEFMGWNITSVNLTNNYRLVEIIIYDGVVNYR